MMRTEHKCSWGVEKKCGKPAHFCFRSRHWLCPWHVRALSRAMGKMALRERINRGTVGVDG